MVLGVSEIFEQAVEIIPTKRNILKIIASVYDPVGFLQPIVIKLKILFQEICSLKIDWDDCIDDRLTNKWLQIVEVLKVYESIEIERCYYIAEVNDPVESVYLHGFSAASESAYAACVYVKHITKAGNVNIKLVISKSRVVPIKKKYTIPRLELLGNYILARLILSVYNAVHEDYLKKTQNPVVHEDMKISGFICWSDSMISLAWIKAAKQEFKMFVENRVIYIRKHVSPECTRARIM